ncbi:Carboxylesterase 2 [Halomonadaceae bacterium LMG 33818]|uniref:alpha/beta hydrolase n=1 Tax=Cernens ardua TaxID=3402176 RepID=UPI003EDBFC57
MSARSLDNFSLQRLGLDYIERPAASGEPQGLLILLHGVGANERSLLPFALEQSEHLHVVLVRAPIELGPNAYGFFQVRFTAQGPVINPQQADASRKRIIEFVAAIQEKQGISPDKTIIAGFSQGGIISASVGLTHPESVQGIGIFSGRILPEIEPLIPQNIQQYPLNALVTHGLYDSKLPYSLAERSDRLLGECGVSHELRPYPCDHEFNSEMQRDITQWINARLLLANE